MLADVLVVLGAIGLAGFLTWFFFGKRAAAETRVAGGIQEVTVVVQGGYSPNVIRAHKGVPLRIHSTAARGSTAEFRRVGLLERESYHGQPA